MTAFANNTMFSKRRPTCSEGMEGRGKVDFESPLRRVGDRRDERARHSEMKGGFPNNKGQQGEEILWAVEARDGYVKQYGSVETWAEGRIAMT
jgi:hypothetical protein